MEITPTLTPTPTIFAMLRVKNESRWITSVLNSILPLCTHIFILDDESTDGTAELAESLPQWDQITVIRDPFAGEPIDERRDKQNLLERVMRLVPRAYQNGDPTSPYWCLAIDGDEVLAPGGVETIREVISTATAHSFALPVLYLWDSPDMVRVDGVYGRFTRPSLFRLFNRNHRFMSTRHGNGANFHCSSVPMELLGGSVKIPGAPLLHYGYMEAEDRRRKFDWYTALDPGNRGEDGYRHVIQGDAGGPVAAEKLMHGGPLKLCPVSCLLPPK